MRLGLWRGSNDGEGGEGEGRGGMDVCSDGRQRGLVGWKGGMQLQVQFKMMGDGW